MAITDEIPKSRLTLTYRTNVNGQAEEKQLPFRLLIMGDLSNGTSKDRALEMDQRGFRHLDGRNLNAVMKDMKMSMQFSVDNRVDPDRGELIEVTLPVNGMKSFTPAQIAENVPKLKALLLLKKLLLEVQNNIDNRKEFRNLLRQVAESPDLAASVRQELAGYEDFKLPTGTAGGASAASPVAAEALAARKAEEERRAKEEAAKKAEAERLAALKAEEDRRAREAAKKAEEERRAKEKAEAERRAKEEAAKKAEAERLAALKAEEERLAKEAAEKAEAERLAAEKAEEERVAKEAAEKAEAEKLAAEKAEAEKLAAAPEAGAPEAHDAGPEAADGAPEAPPKDPEGGGGEQS